MVPARWSNKPYCANLCGCSKKYVCWTTHIPTWQSRSSNLISLNFLLLGYLKASVFQNIPRTQPALKANINQEFKTINQIMLQRVKASFQSWFHKCLEKRGGHLPDADGVARQNYMRCQEEEI
ncbi:hypothetical protein Trydic_g9573 [Trypoxylus dichotomus]